MSSPLKQMGVAAVAVVVLASGAAPAAPGAASPPASPGSAKVAAAATLDGQRPTGGATATEVALAGPVFAPPAPPAVAATVDSPVTVMATVVENGIPRIKTYTATAPQQVEQLQAQAVASGATSVAVDTPMYAASHAETRTPDPWRQYQWHLDHLAIEHLPAIDAGNQLIAVLDTGVKADHVDLAAGAVRCDIGADFTSADPSVSVGNGCAAVHPHGTHVAGVIATASFNGVGLHGTTNAKILPIKVLGDDGSGTSSATVSGIYHAVANGATIINASLAGPVNSVVADAVTYATNSGVLVVAAAGNNRQGGNTVNYPAAADGALAVAATDKTDVSAAFSYTGPTNDISAPGDNVLSLNLDADSTPYQNMSGTSQAAPIVAALAAMYRAQNPAATPQQITDAIAATASDIETAGFDNNTGHGLINPSLLLGGAAPVPVLVAPQTPAGFTASSSSADDRVDLTWTEVTGTADAPLTGYHVYRDGQLIGTSPRGSYSDTTVVAGVMYSYTVTSYGDGGESAPTAARSAQVYDAPPALDTLTATLAAGSVSLSWPQGVTSAAAPLTAYKLYRDGALLTTSTANSYTDADVSAGSSYSYAVATHGPGGESSLTASQAVTIPAPTAGGGGGGGGGGSPAPAPTTPAPSPGPVRDVPADPEPTPVPSIAFRDTEGDVHADAISKVAAAGITAGFGDGTFRPGLSVTRGQMATFLARALKLGPLHTSRFHDSAGSTHETAINAVAAAGIAVGDGAGNFHPHAEVTRGQMAAFLSRALELGQGEVGPAFPDARTSVHADAIARVAAAGIAGGFGDGSFRPDAEVTRGQLATFLTRALEF